MKPVNVTSLVDVIKQRVASGPQQKRVIESVASTLETRDYQHHSSVACTKADRPIGPARRQVVTGSRTFRKWGNPRDPIGWVSNTALPATLGSIKGDRSIARSPSDTVFRY